MRSNSVFVLNPVPWNLLISKPAAPVLCAAVETPDEFNHSLQEHDRCLLSGFGDERRPVQNSLHGMTGSEDDQGCTPSRDNAWSAADQSWERLDSD